MIVILNGAPRSGKSSIAKCLVSSAPAGLGPWVAMGVDSMLESTPEAMLPAMGLRPGGERPDLEPFVARQFAQLYESVGEEARAGSSVVVDVGHHDDYSQSLHTWGEAARRLDGLAVVVVGVRCSLDEIMRRRDGSGPNYVGSQPGGDVPEPVLRWQRAVHEPGVYDLEVDTSATGAAQCAAVIIEHLTTIGAGAALARHG